MDGNQRPKPLEPPSPPDGRTVVVTGGAGFVGSHQARALVADNEVRVVDDLSTGRRSNVPAGAAFFEGDVRDDDVLSEAMRGADVVFHQAGLVSVPESVERPLESHGRNATATLSLLEHARREDARVVAASSVAVYGHPEAVPIAEDHPTAPVSPYGVDKLVLDHYVRLYAALYDLETVVLRYFNVYGPGQSGGEYSGVVETFLRQAMAGDPLTVHGDGEQTRDFVHVSDVVRANLAAARTGRVGRAYNVGSGASTSVNELAAGVASAVGRDVDVVRTDGRPGDVQRSRADTTRLEAELGVVPRVDLATGLSRLVRERARPR